MSTTVWLPPARALLGAHELGAHELATFGLDELTLPALAARDERRPGSGGTRARRAFACPHQTCGKTFTVNGNLKKHIAAKHEHRKDFVCSYPGCSRRFAKKFNMMRHLNVHTRVSRRAAAVAAAAAAAAVRPVAPQSPPSLDCGPPRGDERRTALLRALAPSSPVTPVQHMAAHDSALGNECASWSSDEMAVASFMAGHCPSSHSSL